MFLKRIMGLDMLFKVLREPDVGRVREKRFWNSRGRDTDSFLRV